MISESRLKVIGRLKFNLRFSEGMNKHQRALKAARAAKRIPLVGTAVVLLPVAEGLPSTMQSLFSLQGVKNFLNSEKVIWTGINDAGIFDSNRFLATWLPILAYIGVHKVGLAKYPSRILGKLGLRF